MVSLKVLYDLLWGSDFSFGLHVVSKTFALLLSFLAAVFLQRGQIWCALSTLPSYQKRSTHHESNRLVVCRLGESREMAVASGSLQAMLVGFSFIFCFPSQKDNLFLQLEGFVFLSPAPTLRHLKTHRFCKRCACVFFSSQFPQQEDFSWYVVKSSTAVRKKPLGTEDRSGCEREASVKQ